MYSLSILQVVDPSCFFCEILKENAGEEYEQLFSELNFLYNMVYRDVDELRPASLPVGTFCVVFYEKMKSWCRAILESTTCSEEGQLVDCFLLDYAVYCPIKKSNIRFPVEECQKLPFRARKFRLYQIRPVSLCIDILQNKSEMRPAKNWDTSAIHYFRQLLNECLKIEAQLCSLEDNCMAVDLYLTTSDSVICANDDLVAKKYACYENGTGNCQVVSSPRTPQNGHTAIPLTEKPPLLVPGAGIIPGETLQPNCSALNWATDVAKKIAAQKRAEVEKIKVRRSTGSQNEKAVLCVSEGRRRASLDNAGVRPPPPKDSESPKSPKNVARSPKPFLHSAWCKADPEQILLAEAAERPAAGIRDAEVHPSKYVKPAQSLKENASNSESKEHQTCAFGDVGATSPPDQQHTGSPKFQIVTSPDPILRPVCGKSDSAQKLLQEFTRNTIAEISKSAQAHIGTSPSPEPSLVRDAEVQPSKYVRSAQSPKENGIKLREQRTSDLCIRRCGGNVSPRPATYRQP
ncbi:uncharacterized protein ACNLHF_006977 [Anomaloglossus baeobatrachus]|uniref:uncharacterized protein LOC142254805 n=1 Tax=Anomaloglossus baeobatrachus TaxID=238106 RepID=UPI003F4F78F7